MAMLPCGHDGRQEGCPVCLLFAGDPAFRAAWGGKEVPAQAPVRSLPCVYLGEVTDKAGCNCPGRWKRKCALLRKEVTIGDDCKSCDSYECDAP